MLFAISDSHYMDKHLLCYSTTQRILNYYRNCFCDKFPLTLIVRRKWSDAIREIHIIVKYYDYDSCIRSPQITSNQCSMSYLGSLSKYLLKSLRVLWNEATPHTIYFEWIFSIYQSIPLILVYFLLMFLFYYLEHKY